MPTWMIITLWVFVFIQGVIIVLLMAALGHHHNMIKELTKIFLESTRITDNNFKTLGNNVATLATVVSIALNSEASKEAANIQVKKVTPDGMLN